MTDPASIDPDSGWPAALAALGAAVAAALTYWQGRKRRDASDGADIASDRAREDSITVLTRERNSALERAREAESKVRELASLCARQEARIEIQADALKDVETMVERLRNVAPKEIRDFLDTNFHASGAGDLGPR